MCFGSPKAPSAPPPPPTPPPTPVITPSESSQQNAGDARKKQLDRLRYGLASTIKTKPTGVFGTGAQLTPQATGKTTLG